MYNYRFRLQDGIYTDLACERRSCAHTTENVDYQRISCPVGSWERVRVKDEEGEKAIGRPKGVYDTLNLPRLDTLDEEFIYDAVEELAKRLCVLCTEDGIIPGRILVVGFGNKELTPDSTGPKTAIRVKPTLHISRYDKNAFLMLDCSEIAVFTPDVSASTGLNSLETVKSLVKELCPDLIIAVDSISTASPERLGRTVQISNTGIFPGGIGNLAAPVTYSELGVPVIGIGVPTVIDARLFGNMNGEGKFGEPLLVSPREIDEITDVAARIIADAINQAFGLSEI